MALPDPERLRLEDDLAGRAPWRRFGPYLAERHWGTVREDYSADGDCWRYFPHDHARSRAYRWGEDGLLGLSDDGGRLCFALALWNGKDAILKERMFGLSNPEGNHGEDVKECYYFLDGTPTGSYLKALYKYPQAAFPYQRLIEENGRRGRDVPEFELQDTGIFEDSRYFDVTVEYAKAGPEDVLIRITAANRGPETAPLHLLPTLWCRNTWSWGREGTRYPTRPTLDVTAAGAVRVSGISTLGPYELRAKGTPELLFTENETNTERLYDRPNLTPYVKDGFHRRVIGNELGAVNPARIGTKAAAWYRHELKPGAEVVIELRLRAASAKDPWKDFDTVFATRRDEATAFYSPLCEGVAPAAANAARQAYAGLIWSKQLYNIAVDQWLEGDAPPPPSARAQVRNAEWKHHWAHDILSMPDTWEYPWYAAWDLAFHMVPMATIDPEFAKDQLLLLLSENYLHPSGQLPAYEFEFSDVNPPVHAWAVRRVHTLLKSRGQEDRHFLERAFHKLMLNYGWWVNRKDPDGNHLFSGGFLGLDNIGVFDRSKPLPTGGTLEQADGTAWIAFFCSSMLSIAVELASKDSAYEAMAIMFFEQFLATASAMNAVGGSGLWDEEDGFYYDRIRLDGRSIPLKVRSMVGLIPLLACEVSEEETLKALPALRRRIDWIAANRPELAAQLHFFEPSKATSKRILAIPSKERLVRVLKHVLDEKELLSVGGIRSMSQAHREHPFVLREGGHEYRVDYNPGDSNSGLFGGNSNWRGPVWFPLNYLLTRALKRYHRFYGDELKVECPTGSGRMLTLAQVAEVIESRLAGLFLPDAAGNRPCHGGVERYAKDPHWRQLVLFHEFFDGDTGRGLGASHQTGWTALAARFLLRKPLPLP